MVTQQIVASDESPVFTDEAFLYHLSLLNISGPAQEIEEACLAPIFSCGILQRGDATPTRQVPRISQFGLLAGLDHLLEPPMLREQLGTSGVRNDPRLMFNVSSPSSTFICGSQGSGKSHTLSCMLENCLIPSKVGCLPNPLTGIIFHYDAFISDTTGSPCEAAYLSSYPGVKVRVLCSPTNVNSIRVRKSLHSLSVHHLTLEA